MRGYEVFDRNLACTPFSGAAKRYEKGVSIKMMSEESDILRMKRAVRMRLIDGSKAKAGRVTDIGDNVIPFAFWKQKPNQP